MMTQTSKGLPRTPRQAARRRAAIDRRLDAGFFRALSDPTRLVLLACLAKCARPCSVGEVAECCSVDLSVVSRHLAQLESAGVLEARKQGRAVYYTVRFREVTEVLRALADALDQCSPTKSCDLGKGGCCG
ncbi:MAG TPA: metalloregulator ArsR/SmtB family transcription factor [Phycisphaerales bacterium]|jgi:ArsR family transcriptional regulator|nr:metalloregulator ArsR/SmtB family transcription factor [Phycisphaerales bacterium]